MVVAQKYQIGACYGFGGAAATYQAATSDGREVVLRIFDPAIRQRADIMSAIEQTYAATNALPQDLAVPLLDAGYDQSTGAPFSVSERIPFPSLAQLVAQRPLPPEDVAVIVTMLGNLLDQAQSRQLFHHALKPTNVFVGIAQGRGVRVTDFGAGLARAAVPTQEGYVGSAPWLAPEQVQAGAPAGATADVFAVCLMMFHALTGRSYWRSCQGAVDLNGWQQELLSPRTPPSQRAIQLGVTLNPAYDAIIGCGLAIDPTQRYRTVSELAHAFDSVAGAKIPESQATMAFPAGAFGLVGGAGPGGEYPPPPQPTAGYAAPPPAAGYPGAAAQPQIPAPPYSQPGMAGAPGAPGQPPGGYGQPPPGYGQPGAYGQPAAQAGYVSTQSPSQDPLGETAAGRVLSPVATQRAGSSNKLVPALLGVVVLVLVGTGVFAFVKLGKKSDPDAAASAAPISVPVPADTASAAPAESASAAPAETAAAAPSASASASAAAADADAGAAPVDATIACDPDPCDEIKVDDKPVDLTKPLTLTPGKHVITVSKKDYQPYTEKITVAPGDAKVEKTYKLTAKPAAPSGQAQPSGPSKPCGKFLKRGNK
jgi:hypothetical protein